MRDEGPARCEPTGYKVRRAFARRWQRPSLWNIERKRIACGSSLTGSAPYKGAARRSERRSLPSGRPEAEPGGRGQEEPALGLDPGVKGRKRHVLVGTLGLPLSASIQPADVQDR